MNSLIKLLNENLEYVNHELIEDTIYIIRELNSFINGIMRDIEAVKNAITYEYSNGLAEGKVNKIKVIKRIMYGRCNFMTLRNKILLMENGI